MKDIGIRDLKAHASDLVRQVSEEHATYTITRRGRPVGILGPVDSERRPCAKPAAGVQSWDRLLAIADRLNHPGGRPKSAVRELSEMRR